MIKKESLLNVSILLFLNEKSKVKIKRHSNFQAVANYYFTHCCDLEEPNPGDITQQFINAEHTLH